LTFRATSPPGDAFCVGRDWTTRRSELQSGAGRQSSAVALALDNLSGLALPTHIIRNICELRMRIENLIDRLRCDASRLPV
jgi:hypothetical protein